MCIRDSLLPAPEDGEILAYSAAIGFKVRAAHDAQGVHPRHCLLYTSDAADERSSVDLGGRRIIKKKNKLDVIHTCTRTIKI